MAGILFKEMRRQNVSSATGCCEFYVWPQQRVGRKKKFFKSTDFEISMSGKIHFPLGEVKYLPNKPLRYQRPEMWTISLGQFNQGETLPGKMEFEYDGWLRLLT